MFLKDLKPRLLVLIFTGEPCDFDIFLSDEGLEFFEVGRRAVGPLLTCVMVSNPTSRITIKLKQNKAFYAVSCEKYRSRPRAN